MPRSQSRIVGYMQMLSELQYAVTYGLVCSSYQGQFQIWAVAQSLK